MKKQNDVRDASYTILTGILCRASGYYVSDSGWPLGRKIYCVFAVAPSSETDAWYSFIRAADGAEFAKRARIAPEQIPV